MLAHLRGGYIHVPCHPGWQGGTLASLLRLTQPRHGMGLSVFADETPRPVEPEAVDPAWILATSGTTGNSKGVLHTHRSLLAGIGTLTGCWKWSQSDRQVLALPLFHVHGLGIGLLGALLGGVETTLLRRFQPAGVCEAMAHGGTVFMGVPTMYHRLLAHFEEEPHAAKVFHDARLCTAGSAALGVERLMSFQRWTGQRILERYGMTETLITVSNPLEEERRSGSIGQPLPGLDYRVVDGELQLRGETVMAGYWQDAEATKAAWTQDGWFQTGDQVEVDQDGYMYHRGRRSIDWIKSGGWRIGAFGLEELLRRQPDIEDAAVLGLPDPVYGEVVAAAIVPRMGRSIDLGQLASVLADEVPAYQRVRRWRIVASLPRNALGKVQKSVLRDEDTTWTDSDPTSE